ncbi:FadR/GntR family transcriptional regulator [Leucobacter chromiiresistens]|uniref:DNA-binding transcriptional regulator, FadR family n=1 Tax=Leucobacter chromiiresistens TaxID=1079994 RepID=A0A1H0ZYG6_9MICO|nr:GntR family transcriptional regulator [Leucobacter chromiiresistens]SDQ32458.1 DNA-binding transcriptional regulator, FadR family [Leucobacter chromiiresistens]
MSTPLRGSQKARDTLEYLREKISSSAWAVGDLIPKEPELMELIGVGKSTVREAVRSLAAFGMLETVPGVGTFVRSRTPVSTLLTEFLADHDLEEVLVYRRSLENEAAQHAAVHRSEAQLEALRDAVRRDEQADRDEVITCEQSTTPGSFHLLVVEASGSKLLLDLYLGVISVLQRARAQGRVILGTTLETMHLDHGAVLRAIEARDVRSAAHSMALHVDRDLGLRTDMLDFSRHTERAASLIGAGYDPGVAIEQAFAEAAPESGTRAEDVADATLTADEHEVEAAGTGELEIDAPRR